MYKAKKLCALLCVLLAVCAAAFAVSRYEEKKEQIKSSGEVILEIAADDVTALSWENVPYALQHIRNIMNRNQL